MQLQTQQVWPSVDDMKKRTLALDKPISLPQLRNTTSLKNGDELFVYAAKKTLTHVDEAPLRDRPAKRIRH